MNKNKVFTQDTETDLFYNYLADSTKLHTPRQTIVRKNNVESEDSFLVEKEFIKFKKVI